MIRFLLRFIGTLLIALAFIFAIYDGIRSISDGDILITNVSYVWSAMNERGLQSFQAMIESSIGAWAWRYGFAPVVDQPASAVAGLLGVVLIVLGRKKKPLIGYGRD
jgi:hypothetical protein